ncbi:MAG: hypothetical protein A2Y07_05800 [Planctomycetes bacterium GWF2_50_10]|nr:MAG: hypothetical protein A2Y07_05800 [Planctomycetes bacterium GWF2_50_10]
MTPGVIDWIIAGICGLLIGIAKTGLPGLGVLVVPLMASIIPAKASTGAVLPMLIFADVFAVAFYRRHAVWSHVIKLMPWALAGIVIGAYFMNKVNDDQLKPIIGAIVLLMLCASYIRQTITDHNTPIPSEWYFAAVLGLTAGITTMMANAAGPIMIIYLLAMRLPKNEFIGTGAWYFLILNCIKVPFSIHLGLITADSAKFNLMLAPMIVAGALFGIYLLTKIPQRAFNITVQILAAAAALNLIFPAVKALFA